MVNFCLGTGFLGVPYSFFYGGYIAAVPTLATAAFVTWLTSTWLLEVMSRAQVSMLDISVKCVAIKSYYQRIICPHPPLLRIYTGEITFIDRVLRGGGIETAE